MIIFRRALTLAAAALTLATPLSAQRRAASSEYLYLWTASADSSGPDFLAVYDIRDNAKAARYGDLVATVAVPGRGNGPHHTEHDMPADGRLFANGFRSGQSFVFDLTNPRAPRVAEHFGDVAGLMHPHSFWRLPNGNLLSTFQMQHDSAGMAPGGLRRFAFERMLRFRDLAGDWRAMQEEARAAVHAPAVPVFAGDVSFRMTDFSTRNAERAGVLAAIQFKTGDALQRPAPAAAGTMMMNPPYGERIAAKGTGSTGGTAREGFEGGGSSAEFYGGLASHWKRHYPGWTAWLLSPDMKLPGLMRLKESRRVPMWNGPIECRLFRFDMVAGSNKADAAAPAA
jgi:hypothetical protein